MNVIKMNVILKSVISQRSILLSIILLICIRVCQWHSFESNTALSIILRVVILLFAIQMCV
jgi:hypothetical protein